MEPVTCENCKLKNEYSPLMYSGEGRMRLLVIGSSPSLSEMAVGSYGTSKDLSLFKSVFAESGKNLLTDCWYTTVFGCHYGAKEKPSSEYFCACERRLQNIISELNPKAIMLLGDIPYQGILRKSIAKGRMTGLSYLDLVGDCIPDRNLNCWVCPVWGMPDLLYKKTYDDGAESKSLWEKDNAAHILMSQYISNFYSCTSRSFPVITRNIKTTLDKVQAVQWCVDALSWDYVSFDYETDMRKPYKNGRIYYASISNGKIAYSFPFFGSTHFREVWKNLMLSSVPKVGHNNQFEAQWTRQCLGYWPERWGWDTMLAAHCIHNLKPTNLKYCVYTNWGIAGYDSAADPYIISSDKDEKELGSYAKNRIDELDPDDAMKYNAQDSLYTAWLFEKQRTQLSSFQLQGLHLFMDTARTLSEMSFNGIHISEELLNKTDIDMHSKVKDMYAEIMADPVLQQWDGDTPINVGSTKQLGHLLFDILHKRPLAYTPKKSPALDKETLKKYDMPVLNKLLYYREFKKMADTYVQGWKRECVDGYVHPDWLLNTVDTGRSSSCNPNAQNSYKRDKIKKKLVRSPIIPRPGHRIIEYDYKSLEVMINGDHSNDPALVRYCTDPKTDMHRDGACDVLMLKPEELKGEWRSSLKSLYTFAEFYGSFYRNVAKGIWEWLQGVPELLTHLDNCGIHNYEQFESHMQKCEDKLWKIRFAVHDKWRKQQYETYQRQGYLESYTGFRLQGLMSRNNSFNGAVQGDGFHTLCKYMNKLRDKLKELNLHSVFIDEIHDSLVIDADPEEEAELDYWVWYYGVKWVAEQWKWLRIPLQIEKERSAIDGTWAEMEECGYLTGERGRIIEKTT